jgi:uncharacterized secreted protein with C-terminal beta-propeller domain
MRKAALILALALVSSACVADGAVTTTTTTGNPEGGPFTPIPPALPTGPSSSNFALALHTVDSCDELLDHFIKEALERVGPWGLDGYYGYPYGVEWAGRGRLDGDLVLIEQLAGATATTFADSAGFRAEGGIPGVDFSTTNVQELGVDEPDIVKTDGDRILAIVNNEEIFYESGLSYGGYYGTGAMLFNIEITDSGPEVVGSMPLRRGWGHEMLMVDDKVFVISNGSRPSVTVESRPNVWEGDYYVPQVGVTLISEIDISDPDEMKVVRDLYIDGSYVSGRLNNDVARLVIRSQPTGLEFVQPKGGGLKVERDSERENRRVIEESTIENWLPYFVLEDHTGSETEVTEGVLLDCADVHLPEESAGLGLTSVLTVDVVDGVSPTGAAAAIFAQGETIYASPDGLYVTTNSFLDPVVLENNWRSEAKDFVTSIHKFDISDPDEVEYVATGQVPGYLLNQWAMSEHDGFLRVASTDAASIWGFSDDAQSMITVLAEDDGELKTVGRVEDLGRGERIYAVRYIGTTGFVVTFRQVDPLYVVDLSNPADPQLEGELKIPGYSSYLHPIGEDRLLGIGQDATETGRVLGAQVSLFDISDLSDPKRIDKITFGSGNSEVEYDHRAFLYWANAELAMLPLQTWNWSGNSESYFSGAVGVHVHNDDLHELSRVSHQADRNYWDYGTQIRRSLVIGDVLYTLSDVGLMASDVEDLEELDFVRFSA